MTEQTLDQHAILALYADGPARLETAIAGLSEEALDFSLMDDSWTIRQLVHHIVDGDDLWKIGIKAAMGNPEDAFSFPWYWELPQDVWAERWAYADRSLEPSLALFRASRQHVFQLVRQIPDAWERSVRVRWPNGQEEQVTVRGVVEMQARHVIGHIDDIGRIRQAHDL